MPNKEKVEKPLREYTEEYVKPKRKDRKEYMNKYYKLNKDKLLSKVLAKQTCSYCNRKVAHQQMQKHLQSQYCKTRRLHTIERLTAIKEHFQSKGLPIEDLQALITYAK
jgi:hypothetical protein